MICALDSIVNFLEEEFQDLGIGMKKFPVFFHTGIADAAVHAAGVSYLLSLGLESGLSAIADYPITLHAPSPWKQIGRIFPDSLWFHPETGKPWIAIEFERFERGDENKIREKMENLVLSYHQSGGTIELIVFIYWLRSSLAPKTVAPLFRTFSNGFYHQGITVPPPHCRLLVYKSIMCCLEDVIIGQTTDGGNPPRIYQNSGENREILVLREIRKIGSETQ